MDPENRDLVRFMGIIDPDLDRELDARMRAHMAAHPGEVVRKVAMNVLSFYFPAARAFYPIPDVGPKGGPMPRSGLRGLLMRVPISLFHLALWLAAWYGIWRWRDSGPGLARRLALVGVLFLFVAPYWPFASHPEVPQYATPPMAFLAVLVASAFEARPERRSKWAGRDASPGGARAMAAGYSWPKPLVPGRRWTPLEPR
jgi:hypothetical protein